MAASVTAANCAQKRFLLLEEAPGLEPGMSRIFEQTARSAIRTALARESYHDDVLRLVEPRLHGARWLVSTQNGLFAVNDSDAFLVAHGWFFGMCRRGDRLFIFENCARRDRLLPMGRLVSLDLVDGVLTNPLILAKQLDASCHQITFVDDLLCVVDTASQCVRRFTEHGQPVDVKRPFPGAKAGDPSGDYMHINAIAALPDGIAILAHNGKRTQQRCSEMIFLDQQWAAIRRLTLQDKGCHDIVQDADGLLWHCASMTGEIVCSDGRRALVAPDRMTRGLAWGDDGILVGASVFGARSVRDILPGSVTMLDHRFNRVGEVRVGGPPAVIIAL